MISPGALLQNRYEIIRQLGQGGMGTVFLARDRRLGSTVVLKQTLYNQARLLKAFSGEARLLANLRHPHLPLVTDFFSEGDGHFLVMQFIPGKDLNELLDERRTAQLGPFPLDQVLRWADQLLDALQYLHQHDPPIVHRDIKPQNLKQTPEGDLMLLDFGLAKGAAGEMSQASPSIHGYTKEYASLEQIRGVGTDARSDLYSLAATLYHLLTGEPPVDAVTRVTESMSDRGDPLPKADLLNPQVPRAISEILRQTLSLNADQRPASAAALREALLQAPTELPASRQEASTVIDQSRRRIAGLRPRTAQVAGALIAAISLAGGIYAYRSWSVKSPTAETAGGKTGQPVKLPEAAPEPRVEVLRCSIVRGRQPGDIKLQFLPADDGYLYILAPGRNGALTTLLTNQNSRRWSNKLRADQLFTFPSSQNKFISLESDTRFTIIFSRSDLAEFDFLNSSAERALTPAEQKSLDDLRIERMRFGSDAERVKSVNDKTISLGLLRRNNDGGPHMFEIDIKK